MITEGTQEGSWISLRKALCSSAKLIKYYWLKNQGLVIRILLNLGYKRLVLVGETMTLFYFLTG